MKAVYIFYLLILSLLNLNGFDSFSQRAVFTPVPQPEVGSGGQVGTTDAKGYMWFGGIGVHRYDGYSYKSYFNDPHDTTSLSFNRIESIFADRQGNIWVGTNGGGLDRLNPETGIFTHYRHKPTVSNSLSNDTITVILEDRNGMIWVGTEGAGLNCLDPKTATITRFRYSPNDKNSLSNDQVRALYEDRQGSLWVGTGFPYSTGELKWKDGGLNRFNPATKNFTRYLHDPNDPTSLIDNRVRVIFEDSKGRLWIGTAGDGLHTMNRQKGIFERHRYDPSNPNALSRPAVRNISWLDDLITFITEDATGKLWIGTFSGGLNCYDPETSKINYYASLKEKSTDKNEVSTFWWSNTSKDGVLWILTLEGGIYRLDPIKKQIPHFDADIPVNCLLQDGSGKLWLGTNKGLVVYDSARINKKVFVQDASDTTSLSSNSVISIFEDRMGVIWIGTNNGIDSYDRQSQKFLHYSLKGFIITIYKDSQGSLWVGYGENALIQLNTQTDSMTWYRTSKADTTSISQNTATAILEDREGYLWVGTGVGGVNRFDKKSKSFRHYLPGTSIQSIFIDADDTLWIGTNRGLYFFNPANNNFVLFTNLGAGFTENITVYHIQEDNQHSLWINTSAGLFKIWHNRSEIGFFGKRHSMTQSLIFSQSSSFKGKGGELFFSDIAGNGYYAFFPEQLTGNLTAPALNITGFRLGDQLVNPGKSSPLSLPVSQTREIHLAYNQNVFSFDFTGIHFSNPDGNRHLFMLENLDQEWRKAGEEKTAYYYNVPPGHYVFRVKAASSDGVWSEKSIAIIISSPWWKTLWAYCIYGLLLVAAFLAVHRIQKKRVIEAEREKTRKRELAQAKEIEKAYKELKATQAQLIQSEKMASLGELTAGIAHEIQNPLNFVNNFSDVNAELIDELKAELKEGNKESAMAIADDLKNNEEKINQHGKRADTIVKAMLQHSRISTGQKEPTDINALADEYLRLAYHGMRAKDKSFNAEIQTNFDPAINKIDIVPQDIGRVLLNLYNNAFFVLAEKKKTAQSGYEPKITVTTKKKDRQVEITVSDNGPGIPSTIKDKIFQPFFTTKPTGQGTGLGLSLSYDMMKAHGGELKLNSNKEEGSEFIVELPVV